MSLNSGRAIFRAAAILLLLFTATDLAFGKLWCGEDSAPVARSFQLVAQSDGAGRGAQDGDCFCCCGHVDVTAPFDLTAIPVDFRVPRPQREFVPVAPPQLTFPPPRLA